MGTDSHSILILLGFGSWLVKVYLTMSINLDQAILIAGVSCLIFIKNYFILVFDS